MIKKVIISAAIIALFSVSVNGQNKEYNEEEVRKLLDKYIENPKLYYEKIKGLNERADKANENTMKVSEEYLALLDKKDSLIKIYKNKASMASRMAPQSATPTTQTLNSGSPAKPSQQTTTIVTKVQGKSEHAPYRVQLAAYFREDFEKFFGNFNKTLGIQKLNNRNVIEVQGFKDETEAMEFSQKIQKLGFPGAFVTKYDENGERQEGYKTDNKFYAADPKINSSSPSAKVEKTIQYPDYIPIGYKEHMKKNMEPVTVKASTPASQTTNALSNATTAVPRASSSEPINLRAPGPQRDAIISSTNPTGTPTPQIQKPRTIASTAPVPNSNENTTRSSSTTKSSNTTPPPVNKNTRDQLDVAFDQLFKR